MQRHVAGQKVAIYAHNTLTDEPFTGGAATITGVVSLDWASAVPIESVNPTEKDADLEPGIYLFDMTADETQAHEVLITAVSSIDGVVIDPVWIKTRPPNFSLLTIDSSGRVILQPGQVPTSEQNALALLLLDWTEIIDAIPERCVLQAMRALRNRISLLTNDGFLQVMAEDDSTPAWSKPVTTQAGAVPIVEA